MDFERFLNVAPEPVLPYLGEPYVYDRTRAYRVERGLAHGWWRFRIEGLRARALATADAVALEDRPKREVVIVDHWGFFQQNDGGGPCVQRVHQLSGQGTDEQSEFEIFSRLRTRLWHNGAAIYDELEFESERDLALRQHYLSGGEALVVLKGLSPVQRIAHLYAWLHRERRGQIAQPKALLPRLLAVIHGQEPAEALRQSSAHELAPKTQHRGRNARTSLEAFLYNELHRAQADFLGYRRLDNERCVVQYRVDGLEIESIVNCETLHVYDAGFCLDDHDEMLGLQSLPGVVREARRSGELFIFNHAQ